MNRVQLLKSFILPILIIFNLSVWGQVFPLESPLKDGQLLKIELKETGVYKITGSQLSNAGINLSSIHPENVQLFGTEGGMLPQGNNAQRPGGLKELAIQMNDGGDGSFDSNDFLLFYGEDADRIEYNTDLEAWEKETNLYSESNFYFLKVDGVAGQRITEQNSLSSPTTTHNYFIDVDHHELEDKNILSSGRRWYGEVFNLNEAQTFEFDGNGIVNSEPIKLVYAVMAQASAASKMTVSVNNNGIGEISFNSIPQTTYAIKGDNQFGMFEFAINSTNQTQQITLQYEQPNNNTRAYLDYYTLNIPRKLGKYQSQQIFRFHSLNPSTTQFNVENIGNNDLLWDISSIYAPKTIAFKNTRQSFNGLSHGIYIVFNPDETLTPSSISTLENQNLHGMAPTEFVIITPHIFKTEAERLATFRSTSSKIESSVVDVEQIYNEYSSGRQDITAIRDFIRSVYLKDANQLKYVLLFGDGSYDYKDRVQNNNNFIPIYEAYESLHPIYSYSSDDYFGFMDEDEGEWTETFSSNDHDLELGIGRFPISTLEEAKDIVDKLIRYKESPEALGKWRNRIVLVADDGDFNIHQSQADQLGEFIEENYFDYNVKRLFVDAFPQETTPFGKKSFEVKNRIDQLVENGSLIINYSGHGAETGWASESILDNPQIIHWNNRYKMPLLVTATCEFGRYDDPNKKSGAEYAVLNKNGGAIGLLTTTRPVFSNTNFTVNKAFYNAAFEPIDGKTPRLGDIIRITKNNSISGVINRNFTLLGDPSMTLASPSENAVIKEVNNISVENSEVTINALEKVTLKGEVQNQGSISSDFNGTLEAIVFDKKATLRTLGDDGPNTVMEFESRERVLYQGIVSVTNGTFEINFVVPKNIDYSLGNGKISLYASHQSELRDAGGYFEKLIVGGSDPSILPDENPPIVEVFLEDKSFVNGGLVTPNTQLLLDLEDDQGINVLGNGIEHDITAILDGQQTFILNNFYSTLVDDFTKGSVIFPLENLSPGPHQLKIQAWDTHNNATSTTLNFIVTDSEAFTLTEAFAYPNPSNNEGVTFGFSHNKPGGPLEVTLNIYSLDGKRIVHEQKTFENSPSFVSFLKWETSVQQLEQSSSALYPFTFYVRYSTTGEEVIQYGKVLVNR